MSSATCSGEQRVVVGSPGRRGAGLLPFSGAAHAPARPSEPSSGPRRRLTDRGAAPARSCARSRPARHRHRGIEPVSCDFFHDADASAAPAAIRNRARSTMTRSTTPSAASVSPSYRRTANRNRRPSTSTSSAGASTVRPTGALLRWLVGAAGWRAGRGFIHGQRDSASSLKAEASRC
jgi:hypothetical protein